jgi:hypothetical protein
MRHTFILGAALVAMAGCSSTETKVPVVNKIEGARDSMQSTEKLVADTQAQLSEFQKRLEELRANRDKSLPIQHKERFDTTLDRLLLSVQRSQVDLREIRTDNAQTWRKFESRVNRAVTNSAQPSELDQSDDAYMAD